MKHKHHPSDLIRELLDLDIPSSEKITLIALAEYSDWANVKMSTAELAQILRVTGRQAKRSVDSLVKRGYLSRTPGNGRGNISSYHVNTVPYFTDDHAPKG